MPVIVYGIKNCNTVKSAIQWLTEHHVDFHFHDFKSNGIDEMKLKKWCIAVGWENLLNKRGTTWRQLDPKIQAAVTDQSSAINLMKEKTSVIKRPLIESDNKVIALGFDPGEYGKKFGVE